MSGLDSDQIKAILTALVASRTKAIKAGDEPEVIRLTAEIDAKIDELADLQRRAA